METSEVILGRLRALTRAEIFAKEKKDIPELRELLYQINGHYEPGLRNQMIWVDFHMTELEKAAKI
jgi:hypothetical protein